MVLDNNLVNNVRDRNENNTTILIKNFKNGDTVNYSVIILKGNVVCFNQQKDAKLIITISSGTQKAISYWSLYRGEFRAIIELCRGSNKILIEYTNKKLEISLDYIPRQTNLRVTPVYVICQGHDGLFQSPPNVDNSIQSACSRITVAAKLLQSLNAEKLFENGFGRKTFQLEHEIDKNQPECIIFRSSLNVNKARKMKENELWFHFGRELMMSELGSSERKFLAFISCTRFKGTDVERSYTHDEIVSMTEAHAALGGGGLALFGSACLYTWPTSVNEVVSKFTDYTRVNSRRFMDDSCYRGTIGGCFATTLGSVCHELGHTFDLGHSREGIMGRGFDNIHKAFVIGEQSRTKHLKDNMNNISEKSVQHTTVAFQRNLSVTMNVAEPLRILGPRSKSSLGDFSTYSMSNLNKRLPNVTPIMRPPSVCFNRAKTALTELKKPKGILSSDGIYYTKNCAAMLSYHRWFNNEYGRERETFTRYLKFDKNKMMIISTAGIRVVEVRDEDSGMVLESYEFTDLIPQKRFLVPFTVSSKPLVIVVEDDLGNVLKQVFANC